MVLAELDMSMTYGIAGDKPHLHAGLIDRSGELSNSPESLRRILVVSCRGSNDAAWTWEFGKSSMQFWRERPRGIGQDGQTGKAVCEWGTKRSVAYGPLWWSNALMKDDSREYSKLMFGSVGFSVLERRKLTVPVANRTARFATLESRGGPHWQGIWHSLRPHL